MRDVSGMMTQYGRKDWATSPEDFDPLHAEFGFTLDVCASAENAKVARYYDEATDGLKQDWTGEVVWCNPPYGRDLVAWVEKMATSGARVVVGYIPARTDTRWFHKWVLPLADEIRFKKGRARFVGAPHNAPFPSMFCIWRAR